MKLPKMNMLAAAIALASIPTAPTDAKDKSKQLVEEEIVVVGYRRSLQNAVEAKQRASTIVETTFAVDIGKLPDSSIAETIARLPGVAAQRLDGRASSITIRGLGEDFNPATINGREQVSLDDNRGIEFDVYPSEIVHQVLIYKTPEGRLVNQGIGGTVELKTIRPLDMDRMSLSLNLRGEQNDIGALNPDGDDQGFRGSLAYVDQFVDGKVGLMLAYAHMESPNNEERWSAWGWQERGELQSDPDVPVFGLSGAKPFVRSSMLTRDTFLGTLQLKPSDALEITVDALVIDFEDEKILRGTEIPIYENPFGIYNWGVNDATVEEGVVTAGLLRNAHVVVRNDYETRQADLSSFGLNVALSPNENWTYTLDISRSEVERNAESIETYAGTGRGSDDGVRQDFLFNVDAGQEGVQFEPSIADFYADYEAIRLGVPVNWGGYHPFVYQHRADGPRCPEFEDGFCYRWDGFDGFINSPRIRDELNTLKLETEVAFEDGLFSSFVFGLNHNDRVKEKVDSGRYLTLRGYITNLEEVDALLNSGEYLAALDTARFDTQYTEAVPEEYRLGTVSLDFIGMGDVIAYDTLALYRSGAYYDGIAEVSRDGQPTRAPNTWAVDEKVTTLYAQLNIDSYAGTVPVRGNAGLQFVRTDQQSQGFAGQLNRDGTVDLEPTNGGATYEDILPSANLAFEVSNGKLLRLGYSRTLARARLDRMNASLGYGYNTGDSTYYTGTSGNPELRPYLANQLDAGFEWYFEEEGYLAASLFFKQLDQWQVQVRDDELSDQAYQALVESNYNPSAVDITRWQTTSGGSIQGAEFIASLPGALLVDALEGFGVLWSSTFISSEIEVNGEAQDVPGLSDRIDNFTFYYENFGFEFRTSMRKRSDFTGDIFGLSFSKQPALVKGSEIWDAQIGYDFSELGMENLQLSLQVQNLTDEAFVTLQSEETPLVRDFQRFGRNYLLGLSYKF